MLGNLQCKNVTVLSLLWYFCGFSFTSLVCIPPFPHNIHRGLKLSKTIAKKETQLDSFSPYLVYSFKIFFFVVGCTFKFFVRHLLLHRKTRMFKCIVLWLLFDWSIGKHVNRRILIKCMSRMLLKRSKNTTTASNQLNASRRKLWKHWPP